jgi:3-oxoacyl-[acyl-carrier protein] reductase
MERHWQDCTALVTGGRGGLGRAYADHLRTLGCQVLVTSRHPQGPDELSWDLAAAGATAQLLDALRAREAAVDLLVHAAHAFEPHRLILETTAPELAASLERNVVAVYGLLRGLARAMRRRGFGRVLLIGSLAAVHGGAGQVAYITEKAALEGMMRAFSAEFAGHDVLFNAVHPGIVDTEAVRQRVSLDVLEAWQARVPGRRLLCPQDVVLASVQLLHPGQRGTTGQSLAVTGGVDSAASWVGID